MKPNLKFHIRSKNDLLKKYLVNYIWNKEVDVYISVPIFLMDRTL